MPTGPQPGANVGSLEELGSCCGAGVPLVCHGAAGRLAQTPLADAGWTFEALERNLGAAECTILHSESSRFAYTNESVSNEGKEWHTAPTSVSGTFSEFRRHVQSSTPADGAHGRRSHWYCQKGFPLRENSSKLQVSVELGFCTVDWTRVRAVRDACPTARMGQLSSAQLFASCSGVVSPLHYDTMHNLFCQMSGEKTFLLWPPGATVALKPYPVDHPMDRRSRLDLRDEGHRVGLKEPSLGGLQIKLVAGDLLYLPPFWWHEVHSDGDENISLSIWMRGIPPPPRSALLTTQQFDEHGRSPVWDGLLVGVGRNVESFVAQRVRAWCCVHNAAVMGGRAADTAAAAAAADADADDDDADPAGADSISSLRVSIHSGSQASAVDACLRILAAKLAKVDVSGANTDVSSEGSNERELVWRASAGGVGAAVPTEAARVVEAVAREVLQEFGPVLCRLCGSGSSASQLVERIVANDRLLNDPATPGT